MTDTKNHKPAPELSVSQWLNVASSITLKSLGGKVVVIEAFQMLCPGCVSHGLPQAMRIQQTFDANQVAVLGLHTVFEHHDAMTPVSLEAFVHEYRLAFPIGIDTPGQDGMPLTMRAYGMQGTPSLVIIDQAGYLRHHYFGQVSDLQVGADIATLLADSTRIDDKTNKAPTDEADGSDDMGCVVAD